MCLQETVKLLFYIFEETLKQYKIEEMGTLRKMKRDTYTNSTK